VVIAPLTWNGEARRLEKELAREKWVGESQIDEETGKKYTVIKSQSIAAVQCVACKGISEVYNEIAHVTGEMKFHWCLL
jgi:hypothetical protein